MSTPEKQIANIIMTCAAAVLSGEPTVTISVTAGKRPAGFPRGELLSVGTAGANNYAVCPIKVMAWIHQRKREARASRT